MINFNPGTMRLLHRHGDDWVELDRDESHHDPAAHDPERTWATHRRLFRCRSCDEQVMVETSETTPTPA